MTAQMARENTAATNAVLTKTERNRRALASAAGSTRVVSLSAMRFLCSRLNLRQAAFSALVFYGAVLEASSARQAACAIGLPVASRAVEAQRENKITDAQATELIDKAQAIIDLLSA